MKLLSLLAISGLVSYSHATFDDIIPTTETDITCQTFYGSKSLYNVPTYTKAYTVTIPTPVYVTTCTTTTETPAATTSELLVNSVYNIQLI